MTSPKRELSNSAVPSVEPSSAITICAGPCACASSAASVTGSTAASLCDATITPIPGNAAPSRVRSSARGGVTSGHDLRVTNTSKSVS